MFGIECSIFEVKNLKLLFYLKIYYFYILFYYNNETPI